MKLYTVLLLVHLSWLPSGRALYHEGSIATFTLSNPKRNDSYFGFSITYEAANKRLIVGAPRGSDIGLLFSCDIDNQNCTNIPVDIMRHDIEFTHDFWLGATLKSAPEYFYTCAPRAVGKFDISRKLEKTGSMGVCFKIADNNYSSIVDVGNIGASRYEDVILYGQAADSFGWSMDVGPNESFIIGGPAMFTGRAELSHGLGSPLQGLTGLYVNIRFNLGYSVAISNFIDTERANFIYAIGSPYGVMGSGKVVIVDIDRENSKNVHIYYTLELVSQGVGSMFGAVLCAAHMSGPKQAAALLVGAPAHSLEYHHDVGAVFVYLKDTQIRVIHGEESGSYFGLAIANVGDLNGDNRDEVAIAAPFEAESRGTVYVYCGARIVGDEASVLPMQRLEPRPGTNTHSFGLALASLPDYDQNGCNELAIGAPYSDSVSLLRCFAAVTLEVYAEFPDMKGHNTSYFEFKSCIKVTYPDKPKDIVGSVNVTLRIIHPDARLAAITDSEYTVSLEDKDEPIKCRPVKVSTPLGGNYSTLIEWKMSAIKLESLLELEVFNSSHVLISERSVLESSGVLSAAACSSDICEHNLTLVIQTHMQNNETNPYLIGSSDSEAFSVEVRNYGDTSYDSCVRVYVKDASILTGSVTECYREEGTYTCKPLGSIRKDEPWRPDGDLKMDMTKLTSKTKEIQIFADLYPSCGSNNKTEFRKSIYLKSDSNNIAIKGRTNPNEIINMTKEGIESLGKQIEHVYTISNDGVTNWENIEYSVTFLLTPYISKTVVNDFIDSISYMTPCHKLIQQSVDDREVTVTCVIKKLPRNTNIYIIVPIYITPSGLDKLWKHENETVNTTLSLNLDGVIVNDGVSSTLVLVEVLVPAYIIVAAVLFGLLLVGILAWALYECGFLRRKIKNDLVMLKKDVHRQSMRKSMLAELRQHQAKMHHDETEATCTIESIYDDTFTEINTSTDPLVGSTEPLVGSTDPLVGSTNPLVGSILSIRPSTKYLKS